MQWLNYTEISRGPYAYVHILYTTYVFAKYNGAGWRNLASEHGSYNYIAEQKCHAYL